LYKKVILFVSLFSVFLMSMMPVINSVQIQLVKDSYNEQIQSLNKIKTKSLKYFQQYMNDDINVRIYGFLLLLLNIMIRRSLNPLGRMIMRIISISISCLGSLIGGLFLSDKLLEIPLRVAIAFLYGLLLPILWKAECINIILFEAEGIGPLSKLFVFLRTYAFYDDKNITKV